MALGLLYFFYILLKLSFIRVSQSAGAKLYRQERNNSIYKLMFLNGSVSEF